MFYRSPECVPADFNLLDSFDPSSRPFSSPLHIEGRLNWRSLDDPFPAEIFLRGTGAVPVWFVRWPELEAAVADGELTIGELAALPSLLIGAASFFNESIRNSIVEQRGGNEAVVASGTLTDGGWFQVSSRKSSEMESTSSRTSGSNSADASDYATGACRSHERRQVVPRCRLCSTSKPWPGRRALPTLVWILGETSLNDPVETDGNGRRHPRQRRRVVREDCGIKPLFSLSRRVLESGGRTRAMVIRTYNAHAWSSSPSRESGPSRFALAWAPAGWVAPAARARRERAERERAGVGPRER